ncbi:MAG: glycine cleavage system aminomethyltransferase GcvT [Candidatus Promineifilaceae bacterium]|nr:glycine cleavage system aminomethyltransferase GcvT [Candidatus Promineifilaceae bacterium]
MAAALKRTNLFDWHVAHGGRMVPFAGWEMPVQYPSGPKEEHQATREAAGLFDIDHMGQMEVRGPDAEAFTNWLVTYDVRQMESYDAHYSLMCYPDGGIVDDIFIYKLPDPQEYEHPYFFIAINADNREKDVAWAQAQAINFDVTVNDISDETYMLAFQGPKTPEILNRITKIDLSEVPRFTAATDTIFGDVEVLFGRTGYTGEDGFELYFAAEYALKVWEGIMAAGEADGVLPVGLAARDSLRFEPCMPLYGHEISSSISPIEARLSFAVGFNKNFIGRDAMLKIKLERPSRLLIGFEMIDRGVPRHGYPIALNGEIVGEVTTGMFAPTSQRYLGMAYVPRNMTKMGTEFDVIIRGKERKAMVVKRPFYIPAYRRK